jgi:predicted ester cyclase
VWRRAPREPLHRFLGAFPDIQITPGWSIAESDMIATWIEIEGTHGGRFRGLPATGNKIRSAAIYALRRQGDQFIDYGGLAWDA